MIGTILSLFAKEKLLKPKGYILKGFSGISGIVGENEDFIRLMIIIDSISGYDEDSFNELYLSNADYFMSIVEII